MLTLTLPEQPQSQAPFTERESGKWIEIAPRTHEPRFIRLHLLDVIKKLPQAGSGEGAAPCGSSWQRKHSLEGRLEAYWLSSLERIMINKILSESTNIFCYGMIFCNERGL